jgi:hypothetical protein
VRSGHNCSVGNILSGRPQDAVPAQRPSRKTGAQVDVLPLATSHSRFTGDDLQQIEGSLHKILDMIQERYGGNCVRLVRERCCKKKEELLQWAD